MTLYVEFIAGYAGVMMGMSISASWGGVGLRVGMGMGVGGEVGLG
jgi:hypothetical protein